MIQSLLDEFRAAARQLRLHPGFTLGATLSLALGMSLATAVYSVVAAAYRPLPYPDPDRLITLYERGRPGPSMYSSLVPARHLVALRHEAATLPELAAWKRRYGLLGESGEARAVSAVAVTATLFHVLRVSPLLGRTFTQDDRGTNAIVLSHALWSSQFGSARDIIGRSVRVNALPFTVIGVMPPRFDFPRGTRIWFFVSDADLEREAVERDRDNDPPRYYPVARLGAGVPMERAAAEAGTIYGRLYSGRPRGLLTTHAVSLAEWMNGGLMGGLALWSAAAVLILILCAVNFATMSLSRGMRRRGEIAVRAAMGATQVQLVRASVIEAFLLALMSGALAVVFAGWLLAFATTWFGDGAMPFDPTIDWQTIRFGVGATVLVGFVFALAPAIELARVDLRQILAGGSTSATSRRGEMRGRRLLVSMQLAFALTGVVVVAALIRADKRYQAWDVGVDYEPLVVGDLHGPPRPDATGQFSTFNRDTAGDFVTPGPVLDRLVGAPGITDVAMITTYRPVTAFYPNGDLDKIYWREMRATPNLFSVLGVRLLAGRLPTVDERYAGNTYVASDAFALTHFPTIQDAVGGQVTIHRGTRRPKETVTITGVVPSFGGSGLWNVSSTLYVLADPEPTRFATVVIKVQGDPQTHANSLARHLAGVDARIMVSNVATAKSLVDAAQRGSRGRKLFLSCVAALALALAIIGVYSLTSYTTDLRLREFGIRIALGATTPSLARAVFGDLWWMSTIGIAVGLFFGGKTVDYLDAMFRNPMMTSRLISLQTGPTIVCALTLVLIAVAGCAMPLRRVLKMDVMRTVQGSG